MATQVVSLRLKETEAAYLTKQARRMQRTRGETAALLLSEKLREEEFPHIEFKQTVVGRQPFIRGTRLKVWQIATWVQDIQATNKEHSAEKEESLAAQIGTHLSVEPEKVQAALDYWAAYPDEIDPIVEEVENTTVEDLRRILPNLKVIDLG
jgi:uncharacterized protein (DUF433 family)